MHRLSLACFSLLFIGVMCGGSSGPDTADTAGAVPVIDSLPASQSDYPYTVSNPLWVDSVMASLTPEQRIGQLFMVAAYSNRGEAHQAAITRLVEQQGIGGLIFFQGGPLRQARQTNHYQSKAKVPLLIAMDAEWGLAMRLDSTVRYPRQMTLGAIRDNNLIYNMGAAIAEQCRRLGVHVNFAPVVDVNNNPQNPVINTRSFGEDKQNVARKGIAYMKGLQDNGVMANAKHFPGHGDTDSDSHKTLPVIRHPQNRLRALELYPFRQLINEGLGSMMVAHLYIPALDSTPNMASTLSAPIVTDLLRDEMGFKGLIFTDALNMKGVSSFYKPGEVDLKALLAGNDVLLFAQDVPVAIDLIQKAIAAGQITQEEIDRRCKKIIAAKQWAGLDQYQPVATENLHQDLNDPKYEVTLRKLVQSSLTVVKNQDSLLPIKDLDSLRIASVVVNGKANNAFQKTLSKYASVTHFQSSKQPDEKQRKALLAELKKFDLVICGVNVASSYARKNYGLNSNLITLVDSICQLPKVVVDVFGSPYSLSKFKQLEAAHAVVVSHKYNSMAQDYSAQMLFGASRATGQLPVGANAMFYLGLGLETASLGRFEYTIPEAVGLNRDDLAGIEKLVNNGITERAYPGCQVLVAKEGKVIYNRAFGHHTYEKNREVQTDDIYDLASITKIAGTLPAVMRLVDEKKVDLDYNLCDYLPELVDSNDRYSNMNLREMLAHQAGLVSWIPFFYQTMVRGVPRYDIYSLAQSETYPHRVAENLYIHKSYPDSMMTRILDTKLRAQHDYKYSDLGYYFFMRIVERITGSKLEDFAAEEFYRPLGMSTTGYLPRARFELDRITPTEYDMVFRKQLVHGDVHDPGAAMMGGVGGHAGLFSNANDLAKLMQMYMQGGTYGGRRYLSANTLTDFVRCQFCEDDNRRGAGFDKPVRGEGGPTCHCVSYDSFGHSGFTGTLTWADPEEEVVYVFLSNRVYPDAGNKKLVSMSIRTKVQEVIYDAVASGKERQNLGLNIELSADR